MRTPANLIVSRFEHARVRTRVTEGRELSPKEYLDLIDPYGKRSESSAARYMRKLRSGERSGVNIKRHADRDSGKVINVRYRVGSYTDATGMEFPDVRSANIVLPEGRSRLDLWQGDRLRKAVDRYLRNSYTRRVEQNKANAERYEAMSRLPKDARLVEIARVQFSRYPTEILR